MLTQTHANRIVFALNDAFKEEIAQETINALSDTLKHLNELETKVKELEAQLREQPAEQQNNSEISDENSVN